MKNLIIGILIVILGIGTALAVTADEMRVAIQLQEQSYALGQLAQAQRMHNVYVPYGYSNYYYPGYPYTTYYTPPPAVSFYPYPTERTVVIPVPSATEVSSPADINYSTYTQRTTGTGD